jgi:hypothetical protein
MAGGLVLLRILQAGSGFSAKPCKVEIMMGDFFVILGLG